MRRVIVLGSTGSIGTQALDVMRANPRRFEVVGLAAGTDRAGLHDQAAEFQVEHTALGAAEAEQLVRDVEADVVLNGITGSVGLGPTLAALECGRILALANKESLIVGGSLVTAPAPTEPAPAPLPELPFVHAGGPEPSLRPATAVNSPVHQLTNSPRATQVLTRYVLLPVKSGLMLIDQEAARERILYEQYAAGQERGAGHSQALLFPRPLTFSPADFAILQELTQPLHLLGFRFAEFGPLTIAIEAVPADLPAQGEKELLESLIEQFRSGAAPLRVDRREALARALARRVAQATSQARLPDLELSALVDKLFACQVPNYTPDGRPTVVLLDGQQLADFFRKPGT